MPESGCSRVGGGNVLGEEGEMFSLDPRLSERQKDVGKTCPSLWKRKGGTMALTACSWSQFSSSVDIQVWEANKDNRSHSRYCRGNLMQGIG